jgi:MFS family permease
MRINHVIRTLITSDFLINSGFTVFGPVFAVFVTKQIDGGSMQVVGFAAAIAQIVKSVFQVPVAWYLDRNHGEYDDYYSMVIGTSLIACVPFIYMISSTPAHIYWAQVLFGLGSALAVPPWYAIFTRHIDKMRENVEWSLESIAIGISGASAAALSGVMATKFGFRSVFLLGGAFAILGVFVQAKIYRDLRAFVGRGQVEPLPDKSTQ